MGLFRHLVLLPLAPVEGVVWVAQQIQSQVDRELLDPEELWAEIAELQRAVDEGRISEEEYISAENELLDRIDELEGTAQPVSVEATDPIEAETIG